MSTPHTLGRAFTTLLLGLWCTAALAGTGTDGADNYLIITPPAYAGTPPLQQFTAAKSAQGYNVATYNVPAGTTKETIRSYIASLWGTQNAPDFILIVGDTSGTATSSVNGIPHWVGQGSKHACTDHYYACMGTGDDWYPDICIGRFAVASEAQLQTVVTKSLYVESGSYPNPDYPRRIAFLANSDTYNTAEPTAEYIISTWLEPRDYIPIRIYQAQGGGTTEVRNAINTGCVMVTYMGHSSSSGWWGPRFYQEDVRALSNANLYPLAFGWSCNTSNFETGECFGETFIREANKGAAAYISASNYIYWGSVEAWRPSGILQKAFFRSFFEDNLWRIGPAWQLALYRFLDEYGLPQYPGGPPTQNQDIIRNFFEEFVLLGDPALRLPQPNGFAVNGTPAMQYVCSPPATTAEYTVQVDRHGSFAEPVTLSAADLPPGATAAFVPNGLVPPYTSIMTVSGLAGQVGDYSLTITGTAGAATQSTAVGLKVASALPAQVSLLSPPNNAQQVARQPALSWSPAAQAAEYAVELAATSNFTQLVFSATVTGESVAVTTMLEPEHDYFWRVRARNGCGDGPWSAVFMFTTLAQRDYFTESFGSGFDLANRTLRFIPEATGNYYRACTTPAAGLPTDPNGGTTL
ncbi:MAG: C25 family cysteine peptidase, partial [Planctomycetota bacterium]